jgi:predicted N-acetyltransferase YhbS
MRVPGALAAVAGVTLVGVLPTHRRRGILSSLMRRQLDDLHERGEAVAALFASETVIYPRFGYGRASWQAGYSLRAGEGELAAAGLVAELRPGALASLSAALSWDPAPWCPMMF